MTRRIGKLTVVLAVLYGTALAPQSLSAGTAAYWRHEEGIDGQFIPDGDDTVIDSSGNGNHMKTWKSPVPVADPPLDPPFMSATYSSMVSPLTLRSGLPNTLSLDFGPGGDDADQNDDNYTDAKMIQTQLFTEMTVELAFNLNSTGGWQALFAQDGKPLPNGGIPPLKMIVRGNGQLGVEWVGGNLSRELLQTGEVVAAGAWYHVAFTLTATDAELWVAGETGPYALKASASGDYAGDSGEVLAFLGESFTVGRGQYWDSNADWANALIDEVRVSDTRLTPDEFLFVTVPGTDNADFDGDNDVDGADFLIWQRGSGGSGTQSDGDADGNGTIDGADLAIWNSQFGGPPPALAAVATVPEPATLTLLLGAVLAVGLTGRGSRGTD